MTLRPEYSLGHSQYNPFLFASLGEDKKGVELTVLSALSRLGLDPWREAARLSDLSKEAAARAFAITLGTLTDVSWTEADAPSIAKRVVKFLPSGSAPPIPIPPARPGAVQPRTSATPAGPPSRMRVWLIWAALGLAVVWMVAHFEFAHDLEPEWNAGTSQSDKT